MNFLGKVVNVGNTPDDGDGDGPEDNQQDQNGVSQSPLGVPLFGSETHGLPIDVFGGVTDEALTKMLRAQNGVRRLETPLRFQLGVELDEARGEPVVTGPVGLLFVDFFVQFADPLTRVGKRADFFAAQTERQLAQTVLGPFLVWNVGLQVVLGLGAVIVQLVQLLLRLVGGHFHALVQDLVQRGLVLGRVLGSLLAQLLQVRKFVRKHHVGRLGETHLHLTFLRNVLIQLGDDDRPRGKQPVVERRGLHRMSEYNVVVQLLVDNVDDQPEKEPRQENVRVEPVLVRDVRKRKQIETLHVVTVGRVHGQQNGQNTHARHKRNRPDDPDVPQQKVPVHAGMLDQERMWLGEQVMNPLHVPGGHRLCPFFLRDGLHVFKGPRLVDPSVFGPQ